MSERIKSSAYASVYRALAIAVALAGASLRSRSASTAGALLIAAIFLAALLVAAIPRLVVSVATAVLCAAAIGLLIAAGEAEMMTLDRFVSPALVLICWLLARQRRRNDLRSVRQHAAGAALAVLDQATGEIRLTEEIERSRKYARPLSLVRLSFRQRTGETAAVQAHLRDTLRSLVSRGLRGTDIPFDDGTDAVVAILTETAPEDAWIVVARFSAAVERTTIRQADQNVPLDTLTDVRFAVAGFPQHGETSRELLESLRLRA